MYGRCRGMAVERENVEYADDTETSARGMVVAAARAFGAGLGERWPALLVEDRTAAVEDISNASARPLVAGRARPTSERCSDGEGVARLSTKGVGMG